MKLKGLVDEDFVNYRKASMFLGTSYCDGKCCKEAGIPLTVCQNSSLFQAPVVEMPVDALLSRYLSNPLTSAIVVGGLEPMLQFEELLELIRAFREATNDDIVIYTGYYSEEISDKISQLQQYENIIIKFGRYIPGHQKHFDDILGVELASDNQFAERIS